MIHKGEVLKKAIYRFCQNRGMSLTALAKKAGYDQSTPYRHFEKEDLPNHIILRWGKAMAYDFRNEFPELAIEWERITSEPFEINSINQDSLNECKEKMEYWKNRYIDLLERYNEILVEKMKK